MPQGDTMYLAITNAIEEFVGSTWNVGLSDATFGRDTSRRMAWNPWGALSGGDEDTGSRFAVRFIATAGRVIYTCGLWCAVLGDGVTSNAKRSAGILLPGWSSA
jgi:hypothetical protein